MDNKKGFTLIELSLATVFLSILLLMIATITINVSTIYQKGLTLRNVNSTGRMIIDDLTRSIADAPLTRLTSDQRDVYFRERIDKATVKRVGGTDNDRDVQYSGAFCSGRYSYVWNTGYVLNSKDYAPRGEPLKLKYNKDNETKEITGLRLVKFSDPARTACSAWDGSATLDISRATTLSAEPEEMLSVTDTQIQLALYELNVFPVTQDSLSLRSFYSGTFILATLTGSVDVKSEGNYCDPSNSQSLAGDFNYCAVNKFNFAAQASGENRR